MNRRERRHRLYHWIAMGSAAIALVCVGVIIGYYVQRNAVFTENASIAALLRTSIPETSSTIDPTIPPPSATPTMLPTVSPLVVPYPTRPRTNPAFDDLLEANPDTVGRLYATTLEWDYIVVQRDNEYYLTHNFYGEPSASGTLFVDEANELYPVDQNVIIYGHNMKNGTMFARLTRYRSPEFARVHPLIHFDTLYDSGVYVVYAALNMEADAYAAGSFQLRSFLFNSESFHTFLQSMKQQALYVTPIDMQPDDQLLTLITCSYYSQQEDRFVLVLRKLRADETEASMTEFAQTVRAAA